MTFILAITPVFLIILIGYCCRYYNFPDDTFWRGAEKVTYFLLFPALLVSKMATANLADFDVVRPLIAIILMYLAITGILLVTRRFVQLDNPQFTSVYQGSIRFNTYIGFAVVVALYGANGLVLAVVLAAVMIPIINFFCISILEFYRHHHDGSILKRVIKSVVVNPLIVACVVGIVINLTHAPVPKVVLYTLDVFSRAALPMGLLTVGAALQFRTIRSALKPLLFASGAKFLVLPTLAIGLGLLMDIPADVLQILLVLTALPTATASYVLSKQLGGDHQLMATIITGETLIAVVSMPIMLAWLGSYIR